MAEPSHEACDGRIGQVNRRRAPPIVPPILIRTGGGGERRGLTPRAGSKPTD